MTVEFVLWVPVMVLMLTLATDATILMHEHQNMYNMARDASRQVALGQKTEADAEAGLKERIALDSASVDVAVDNGFVTTTVAVPFSEHANLSGFFLNGNLVSKVSMWVENNEE